MLWAWTDSNGDRGVCMGIDGKAEKAYVAGLLVLLGDKGGKEHRVAIRSDVDLRDRYPRMLCVLSLNSRVWD